MQFNNLEITICLCIGLRIRELCVLKWKSFNLKYKVLKVRHSLQRIYIFDVETRYTKIKKDIHKTKESIEISHYQIKY